MLFAVAALLVPAALAWACGPNRAFQLSHSSCDSGCTMTATGVNFPAGATLELSIEPGGPLGSTVVPANGAFSMSFTAPSAPGSYVVQVVGFDENRDYIAGTPARQSFSIVLPQAPPQPQAQPAATADSSATSSDTPADTPATPADAAAPASSSPPGATSRRPSERSAPRNATPPGTRGDRARRTSVREPAVVPQGAAPEPTGVVSRAREPVFAGSIARSERVPSKQRSKSQPSTSSTGRPFERSANADVWSGFSPSDGPSLMPRAGAAEASDSGASSALLYGVLLLGLGSLALAGGLVIATARRRRT